MHTGTTPVSLAAAGEFEKAANMIVDPFHDLTDADQHAWIEEIGKLVGGRARLIVETLLALRKDV